jgi:hypothetical protein
MNVGWHVTNKISISIIISPSKWRYESLVEKGPIIPVYKGL